VTIEKTDGLMRRKNSLPVITIRNERPLDIKLIRKINEQAFRTPAEAQLVDLLRTRGKLVVSLVASVDDQVAGHIAFSPVKIAAHPEIRGVGLGPVAVLPAMQRQGIGSVLVRKGLECCREMDYDYAVVVGHPNLYPRFGFIPAIRFGINSIWELPEGVFMALELRPQSLVGISGLVTYEPEFNEV
jgi:putative acetyltransferase